MRGSEVFSKPSCRVKPFGASVQRPPSVGGVRSSFVLIRVHSWLNRLVPVKTTICVLLLVTVVTGCSSSTGYVIGAPRNGSLTRSTDITIVDHADPRNYHVVGRVHAHSRAVNWLPWLLASQEKLLEKLKREAALLHGEVVFDIKRYSRSQFEWQEEHLMGTVAVILTKEAGDAP